jgi:hypothetical protein
MYTEKNFKTKKQLKDAVIAFITLAHAGQHIAHGDIPVTLPVCEAQQILFSRMKPVTYYQPGPFGGNGPKDGTFCCEGPHYPEPHKWYATCTAKDGVIVKVK